MTAERRVHERDAAPPKEDLVTVTIDGIEISVPKGTLLIRAAEQLGIQIPRFCDHPLLDPAGACRQCLVEVTDMGNGRGMPKPAASCTTTVMPGMVIKTQLTSAVADKAQQGVMELLLINHPLDCPVCDKGGECPLQNQAMSNGRAESRFHEHQADVPQADRDLVATCCSTASAACSASAAPGSPSRSPATRSSTCSSAARSSRSAPPTSTPFQSYFSGNTVQICPVGALTGASLPVPGPAVRPDVAPTVVRALLVRLRAAHRLAARQGHPPAGRRGRRRSTRSGTATRAAGRSSTRRSPTGCSPRWCATTTASWSRRAGRRRSSAPRPGCARPSTAAASACCPAAGSPRRTPTPTPSSPGSRSAPTTSTSAPGRSAPRSWPSSASHVAGVDARARLLRRPREGAGRAARRLRARGGVADRVPAAAQGHPRRHDAGARRSRRSPPRGLDKLDGTLMPTVPGAEADALGSPATRRSSTALSRRRRADPGRRAAGHLARRADARRPTLAATTGARLAWVPRRAGERGAVDAGALPTLLPGGRRSPTTRPGPRSSASGAPPSRQQPGRDSTPSWPPPRTGRSARCVVGGVDPADLADPALAARGARTGRLRRQPGDPRQRGDRARRRGAAGRPGRREGRPLRDLGRPPPPVRPDAHQHRRAVRRPRARRARRGARRRPRPADVARAPGPSCSRSAPATAPRRPPRRSRRRPGAAADGRGRCSRPGTELIDAGRCRTATRTWPAPPSRPARVAVGRRPPPSSAWPTATRSRSAPTRGAITRAGRDRRRRPTGVVWLPTNARGCAVRPTLGAGAGDRRSRSTSRTRRRSSERDGRRE